MKVSAEKNRMESVAICRQSDLIPDSGVCVFWKGAQIALFYIPDSEQQIFAISNWDPIGKANVLSRGIIGDIKGELVVASPLYKQHFSLLDGRCLESDDAGVRVYPVWLDQGRVLLALPFKRG